MSIGVEQLLAQGLADHKVGRIDAADRCYRKILAQAPSHADAWHLSGLASAAVGDAGVGAHRVHRAITVHPGFADFHYNLGNLQLAERRYLKAAASFERAIHLNPQSRDAYKNLGVTLTEGTQSPDFIAAYRSAHPEIPFRGAEDQPPRYHLIRPWGCGFFGEVHHALVQVAFAEIANRIPVILWNANCRYCPPGVTNAWPLYFEPVSDFDVEDLLSRSLSIFPRYWDREKILNQQFVPMEGVHRLNNPDAVSSLSCLTRLEDMTIGDCYNNLSIIVAWATESHPFAHVSSQDLLSNLTKRYLRPAAAVRRRVDLLADRYLANRSVLAVHYRAQHKYKREESLEKFDISYEAYEYHIDQYLRSQRNASIFLLTDLTSALNHFQRRYGDRIISLERTRMGAPEEHDLAYDHSLNGETLAREVLEDAFLALRCDAFLGDGASGVSNMIAALSNWPAGQVTLLRKNVYVHR